MANQDEADQINQILNRLSEAQTLLLELEDPEGTYKMMALQLDKFDKELLKGHRLQSNATTYCANELEKRGDCEKCSTRTPYTVMVFSERRFWCGCE